MTLQAIQVSFLDSVPNDLVIPWGFGCVPAVAMGVGTVFGSQRMTTTVGAFPIKLACNPPLIFPCHPSASYHEASCTA